ncbi:hypothetical protein BH09VER1_BH09VER1_17330 [soil metagenome]
MNLSPRRINKQQSAVSTAFTLIELIVVVSIVVILATLLFPLIGTAMDRAKGAACVGNLRSCGGAILSYAADHDGKLPPSTLYTYPQADATGPDYEGVQFTEAILNYISSGKMLYCPTAKVKYNTPVQDGGGGLWSTNGGNVFGYQYYGGSYRKHSTGWNSPTEQCPDRVTDPGNYLLMGDIVGRGNPAFCATTNMSHVVNGKVRGGNVLFMNGAVIWYPYDQLTVSPASDWLIPDIKRPVQ